MIIRNQNADGEIVTSGQQFITGKAAVGVAVARRLRTYMKEYFLNVEVGVPYSEVIFAPSSLADKEAAIKLEIINTEGVEQILAFTFDINEAREIQCIAVLRTDEGDTVTVNESLNVAPTVGYTTGVSYGAD